MSDPHDLERFVVAQDGGVHERALAELRNGLKTGHWMWFIFPQFAGLGRSDMSRRYAIADLEEARAHLAHPVLGPRYAACLEALLDLHDVALVDVLGPIDTQKLHSSLTLFAQASPQSAEITDLLSRHFDGKPDRATLDLLGLVGS